MPDQQNPATRSMARTQNQTEIFQEQHQREARLREDHEARFQKEVDHELVPDEVEKEEE